MTSWLDDIEKCEIVPLVPTSIEQETPAELSKTERDDERLLAVESKILEESLNVLERVPGWIELDPKEPEKMPEGWITKFGEREATRRHRIAQAAMLSERNAPMGLHLHRDIVEGVMKRRQERGTNQKLNIQVVQIPIQHATINYTKQEVDD